MCCRDDPSGIDTRKKSQRKVTKMDEREELNRDDVNVCRNPGEIIAVGFILFHKGTGLELLACEVTFVLYINNIRSPPAA